MKGFYKNIIIVSTLIWCLFFLASSSPCQWYTSGLGGYAPNYYGYGQPNYGGYYPNYGYSQPQYYSYAQPPQYYGYSQPAPYYGYSQPQYYGGYPSYRQPSYNQPYYGTPYGGYYQSSNYLPYQYFGYPYTQQNPIYNPYGVFTGDWEDWSYLPSRYKNADLILEENDNDDDFTVEIGDSIAIILPSQMIPGTSISGGYEWAFDDDDFDDDVLSHNNTSEWFSGYQFWYFEAEEAGTTTIKFGNVSWLESSIGEDSFEVEITVEE